MSKELIRLRNLCMAFDDELVLDNINLYIIFHHLCTPSNIAQQDFYLAKVNIISNGFLAFSTKSALTEA